MEVGLVLGVLPLIISALENYEVTFRPFVTYCRYSKELRDFHTRLATQKQLFKDYCLILLSRIGAAKLLESPSASKSRWRAGLLDESEQKLADRVTKYLGRSHDTCRSLIELIERTVLSIQQETQNLKEIDSQVRPNPVTLATSRISAPVK